MGKQFIVILNKETCQEIFCEWNASAQRTALNRIWQPSYFSGQKYELKTCFERDSSEKKDDFEKIWLRKTQRFSWENLCKKELCNKEQEKPEKFVL